MPILLLRHEERNPDNHDFNTHLNDNGIKNSYLLVDVLNKYEIDHIYCSPFPRALQTITPYLKNNSKMTHINYGIAEDLQDSIFKNFDFKSIKHTNELNNYICNINENDPFLEKYKYPETTKNTYERVVNFYNFIINKYDLETDTILLCTHKSICEIIVDLLIKHKKENCDYKMGQLSYIDHGELVFIN